MLDKEEVLFAKNKGYLYGTHVVVGLPQCLAEASKEPHAVAVMQHTLAVAVDEVDACFLVSPCMVAGLRMYVACRSSIQWHGTLQTVHSTCSVSEMMLASW